MVVISLPARRVENQIGCQRATENNHGHQISKPSPNDNHKWLRCWCCKELQRADTGTANAYVLPVASLASTRTLQFRALNSNTGTSTLNTTATGTRGLVNADGSNLAAATILANAAVQVTWDGTNFVLAKRPFNDRVVVSGSN